LRCSVLRLASFHLCNRGPAVDNFHRRVPRPELYAHIVNFRRMRIQDMNGQFQQLI
jgi:hypothetical protein